MAAKQSEPARRLTEEERAAKIKKLKRKRKIRRFIVAAGFLIIVAAIAVPLFIFSVFRVKTIRCKGNVPYENSDFTEACPIKTGDNLVFCDFDKAEKIIEAKLPYVKKATITRDLPSTLIISATPAKEAAAIELDDGKTYIILDENFKILTKSGNVSDSAVIFRTIVPESDKDGDFLSFPKKLNKDGVNENENLVKNLKEIYNELADEKIDKDITYVNLKNTDDIRIVYDNRIVMKLGNASELASKIELGAQVIREENQISTIQFGTMDLTISKKAFFNPDVFEETEPEKDENKTPAGEPVTDENGEPVTDENGEQITKAPEPEENEEELTSSDNPEEQTTALQSDEILG